MAVALRDRAPLAARTTLRLGGPAERLLEADREEDLLEALREADERGVPVALLGGGSNVVVPDEGVAGWTLRPRMQGARVVVRTDEQVVLQVAAGEPWDRLVAWTVAEGWQGLETLSAIPGLAGAAPVQNVGAYGTEVAEVLLGVRLYDRVRGRAGWVAASQLRLGYRQSVLKAWPGRYVVLSLRLALRPGAPPALHYAALREALGLAEEDGGAVPSLRQVREAVIALRTERGMGLPSPEAPGTAGSFFVNPVLERRALAALLAGAIRHGALRDARELPRWPAGPGRWKVAAAWLLEAAGYRRGLRRGAVGISPRHALALVHHGGGRTHELLALAAEARSAVAARFGVGLRREPVLLRPLHPNRAAPALPLGEEPPP